MRAKFINETIKYLTPRSSEEINKKLKTAPIEEKFLYAIKTDDIETIEEITFDDSEGIYFKLGMMYLANKKMSIETNVVVKVYHGKIDPSGNNNESIIIEFLQSHNITHKSKGTFMGYPVIEFKGKARDLLKFIMFIDTEQIEYIWPHFAEILQDNEYLDYLYDDYQKNK